MFRKRVILMIFLITLVLVISTVLLLNTQMSIAPSSARSVLVDDNLFANLPKDSRSKANIKRISANILPPTNSWLSGMVLQDDPLAVYPMPLSIMAKDNRLEIGMPQISAKQDIISGPHVQDMTLSFDAEMFVLTRYDKVSATLTYYKSGTPILNVTFARGSPYVYVRATKETVVNIASSHTIKAEYSSGARYNNNISDFAFTTNSQSKVKPSNSGYSVELGSDQLLTAYVQPQAELDYLKDFALNELSNVETSYVIDDQFVHTTLTYNTLSNSETVFVPLTYRSTTANTPLTYDSIYGPMNAVRGNDYVATVPKVSESFTLDFTKIDNAEKSLITEQLRSDVKSAVIKKDDMYFGGKHLARAAQLLELAVYLDQQNEVAQLKQVLNDGMQHYLKTKSLYYDNALKGVVSTTPSFGSEEFNDHHFHYGYHIYAAAILAQYDNQFLGTYRSQINLLAADISSYDTTDKFPLYRPYDPYAGHSWAAGLAPFADGNNQESSSEAINAWNGIVLWSKLTGNHELENTGYWLLANESATAQKAWRSVDKSDTKLMSYTHRISPLNFGGKRTYATFFSDTPSAKLGIQLLPMSPVMYPVVRNDDIEANVIEAIQNKNFNVPLGDYILMYYAITDPRDAKQLYSRQRDEFIDDGNSKAYTLAWISSLE